MRRFHVLHLLADSTLRGLHLGKLFLELCVLLGQAILLRLTFFVFRFEQVVRFFEILDASLELLSLVSFLRCIARLQANSRRR